MERTVSLADSESCLGESCQGTAAYGGRLFCATVLVQPLLRELD
jgi:hypothetical protein